MDDKKKRSVYIACSIVGLVTVLIYYIFFAFTSVSPVLYVVKVMLAETALIAFSIRLGIEIINEDSYAFSIFFIIICLLDFAIAAI